MALVYGMFQNMNAMFIFVPPFAGILLYFFINE